MKVLLKEYEELDAIGLAEWIRSGAVSAAEVLEEAIRRAESANVALNFIAHRAYDEARGVEWPLIWTAERDRELWAALQG